MQGGTVAYGRPQPEPPRRSAFNTAFTATFGVLAALVVLVILGNWIDSADSQSAADSANSDSEQPMTADDGDSGDSTPDCMWNVKIANDPMGDTITASVTPDCRTTEPYAERVTIELQQPMASGGDWYTVHQETTDTITGDSNIIGTATASTTCQWGQWRAHMTVNDQPAQGAPGKSRSSTTRTARACLWTTIARRQARATNSPPAAATASRRLSQ